MPFKVIIPEGAPPPLAPYSPSARAGNIVYVGGTLAMDASGKTVGVGDVRVQTRNVLDSIKAIVGGK